MTDANGGVAVVEHKWHREVRNPALDADPFAANDEQRELRRAQVATAITERNRSDGQGRLPPPTRKSRGTASAGNSVTYVYEVKVGNTGAKAIRALVWEYVVLDRATGSEVGRHRFTSDKIIDSGKSKRLSGRSESPPARVVDAASGGAPKELYSEGVIIQRIEFADGSVWQRPVE